MAIVRWSPFSSFTTMERELRDVMDRFWGQPGTLGRYRGDGFTFRPAVDIYRQDDQLIVTCELPGIDPEKHLDITVEGNVLLIKGQRSFVDEIEQSDLYLSERLFGSFERHVHLPEGIDADQLEANYEHGVLKVIMPLPEGTLPKTKKLTVSTTS